jgi:hypothetical protein
MEASAYFTLELARPFDGWYRLEDMVADARKASEQMQREGIPVRFVRSIFVPEDEACFYLYKAASVDSARAAVQRAGLVVERVAEPITDSRGRDT